MKTFNCNIAQPGLYVGPVVIFSNEASNEAEAHSGYDVNNELASFDNSISILKSELDSSDLGQSNSEIIEAMTMILEDESFVNGVYEKIRSGSCPATTAVKAQTSSILSALETSGSDYLKGRCADVRGISERLVAILSGNVQKNQLSKVSAIASEEISPILLSSINADFLGALISDKGSPNSHASIIAGNLGIPYLYGAGEAISLIKNGQTVVVDGFNGVLTVEPDTDTHNQALEKMEELTALKKASEPDPNECVSCKTKIMANISGPNDIPELIKSGADGVGLFRTELLFLNSKEAPSEEEQYAAYVSVLEAMEGKEVIIRTMDLGSDKTAGWLELPNEINPALGLRGARVSLERPDLIRTQLRALLRASTKGRLKIMFPMIASEWEVDRLIEAVNSAASELEKEGASYSVPEIGIMIETPGAVLIAEKLAEKVSFFSIGSNDLTQYTLALDREALRMDKFFDPRHEAVLRLIEMTAEKARKKGVSVGICGQLAADFEVTKRFVNCGIDELSVPVSKIKALKKYVSEIEKEFYSNQTRFENVPQNDTSSEENGSTNVTEIAAVADGEIIPMEEIPDETFASGILGPCIGILPDNGNVYAPCDGTIKSVAETKHAITIESNDGMSYLIHIGIDTVNMKGKAFDVHVSEGQKVKQGDLIVVANLKKIEKEGYSTIIITIRC